MIFELLQMCVFRVLGQLSQEKYQMRFSYRNEEVVQRERDSSPEVKQKLVTVRYFG